MAELFGPDLGVHLSAIVAEFKSRETIYGYPKRKMYLGFPGVDFSVDFHHRKAATPLGPASGPHTQMVQNIILSFLGGGRIMELKTIQVLDRLEIPRPCIDVRNVGFNVEWSQELRLEDSYREYVTAWVLLKILEETEILGIQKADSFYDTVFDISVGYDLKGIQTPQVHQWLESIKNAEEAIESYLQTLPPAFSKYRKLHIDPCIADTATLSTFHGCPPDEIEAIVRHLIAEHQLHVIVKMNPTILGYDFVEKTLRHDLGYEHIELDPKAFADDLQFDDGVGMMKRLLAFGAEHGRRVGAKFTNTLVVKNNENVFKDEVMYLSGAPLHVLSMNAMHRFRTEMSSDFHISFSAGINKHNFVDAVRCNMKPVSVCTDLLKTGGYTRMPDYLKNLKTAMEACSAATLGDFIVKSSGGTGSPDEAGVRNAEQIVPALIDDKRYHKKSNVKTPPKIDSHLRLFDCITCNKCLPVCPNAANFSVKTGTAETPMLRLLVEGDRVEATRDGVFVLEKEHQIANLADFCNECGDCDTYCPEHGGPFIEKPRFFSSEASYRMFNSYDGFVFPAPNMMKGRIDGVEYELSRSVDRQRYTWRSAGVEAVFGSDLSFQNGRLLGKAPAETEIDTYAFYVMKALFDGIINDNDSYSSVMLRGASVASE